MLGSGRAIGRACSNCHWLRLRSDHDNCQHSLVVMPAVRSAMSRQRATSMASLLLFVLVLSSSSHMHASAAPVAVDNIAQPAATRGSWVIPAPRKYAPRHTATKQGDPRGSAFQGVGYDLPQCPSSKVCTHGHLNATCVVNATVVIPVRLCGRLCSFREANCTCCWPCVSRMVASSPVLLIWWCCEPPPSHATRPCASSTSTSRTAV